MTTKNSEIGICDKNAQSEKLRVKPVLGQIVNFCMSVLSAKIKALHESMFYYFSLTLKLSVSKDEEERKKKKICWDLKKKKRERERSSSCLC